MSQFFATQLSCGFVCIEGCHQLLCLLAGFLLGGSTYVPGVGSLQ